MCVVGVWTHVCAFCVDFEQKGLLFGASWYEGGVPLPDLLSEGHVPAHRAAVSAKQGNRGRSGENVLRGGLFPEIGQSVRG